MMANKTHSVSGQDRLVGLLVTMIVLLLLLFGAAALFATGIFNPVKAGAALEGTQPLNLPTPPPQIGPLGWLFASAVAEEESAAQVQEADLDALLAEIVAEDRGESDISDADLVTVDRKDLAINENLPSEWFNVLLMGVDTRGGSYSKSRSDVMIVASINGKTGEIKLTSFSRDMYVPIPNGVGQNRINAAFAYGGWELAAKTINQNFELNIKNYVAVNFEGMAAFIDALGGVDIELVGEEYYHINYNVAVSEDYEGFPKSAARSRLTPEDSNTVVHLDGLQAVGYARIRKMDSDIVRNSRQRILMQALLDKVLPVTIQKVYNLSMIADRYCQMYLSMLPGAPFGNVIGEIVKAPGITLSEMSIPVKGSFHSTTMKDKNGKDIEVLSFNQQQNVQELHKFIYGEYIPAEKK